MRIERLTDGFGIQRRAIGSGLRYVGEYLPAKQAPVDVMGPCSPVGPLDPIILSGEYITTTGSSVRQQLKRTKSNEIHQSSSYFCEI